MKDVATDRPLVVSTDGTAGPYIMVPVSQLDSVQELLDENQIDYSVDEHAIALDGSPEIAVVNFGRKADAKQVQKVLDSAA